jgi:hypothetical protein
MAKHRSYSIEFERQVAQEYIAAQFPVVLARVLQGNLLELFPRLRRSHLIGTINRHHRIMDRLGIAVLPYRHW